MYRLTKPVPIRWCTIWSTLLLLEMPRHDVYQRRRLVVLWFNTISNFSRKATIRWGSVEAVEEKKQQRPEISIPPSDKMLANGSLHILLKGLLAIEESKRFGVDNVLQSSFFEENNAVDWKKTQWWNGKYKILYWCREFLISKLQEHKIAEWRRIGNMMSCY